jgi:hypothetical protein
MQNKTTRAGRDGGENQGWLYLVVLGCRFRRQFTFFSKIQDVKKMRVTPNFIFRTLSVNI